MTSARPLIEVRDVQKQFRSRSGASLEALLGTSLNVEANQFICIVGPSGCGKSTLLRMIAGLETTSAGAIGIDGTAVKGPRRDIGLVFQSPVMLPWRTILQNIMVPAEVLKLNKKAARARADELLTLVGLDGFGDRYPDELSGGMRQRAAIARALMHDPRILLMDEPFGALDALTREAMNLELLRIWEASRKTVILVTHSIEEALLLSDRVAVFAPRPGFVRELIDVPIARPRSAATRSDPHFVHLAERLRAHFTSVPTH
ncbi:NitT/TauT family transport system ATP-binding protein [Tardiphaga robiniae]|uniref:ABC transporter ATP-binding protein n=1 Tax=Tardiphaga robiniae TaxID=943830 RepID=UPI002866CA2A|nr:ABC transporter ATP-binding protein [Tardiphaga robiniae]MDR6658695.1 NitT/TauT family transport system ATP-binding protein [Tardiphaga robiniae]